jgi:branched-subunit amino acid aminotransferase/4-amino-4-deoxychorismate lyase
VNLLALAVSDRGLVDPDEPAVYADDEAFLRGRGAFETIRVYGGRPFRLADHLHRLAASASRLGLPAVDAGAVEALVLDALAAAGEPDCVVRIYCTPGRESSPSPKAYVLVRPVPAEPDELRARGGIELISVPIGLDAPDLLAGVKSTSYALNMVAIDRAKAEGADDAVFLGTGEVVLECPTSNVWLRRDRTLFTPALDLGILAGVTRGVILELAPELGYETAEGTFTLAELKEAEEVFTSSSVREVMPAAAVDDARFRPGAAAAELQDALRRLASPA